MTHTHTQYTCAHTGGVPHPRCCCCCCCGLASLSGPCLRACRFSYLLLLYCRQLSSKKTFEDMAEETMGLYGRIAVSQAARVRGGVPWGTVDACL